RGPARRPARGQRSHAPAYARVAARPPAEPSGAAQALAQCRQISLREVVPDRTLGLLRHIDFTFTQALDQISRREVDDLDIIGLIEDTVGHGFAHAYPGDAGDDVVETLDMLNVERREDVDAGGDQLFDIEIALGMPASRRVGVGQLVDKYELGTTL